MGRSGLKFVIISLLTSTWGFPEARDFKNLVTTCPLVLFFNTPTSVKNSCLAKVVHFEWG